MKKNNVLKKLASDAKNRLKHCNYADRLQRANIIRNIAFENHIRYIKESQNDKVDVTITIIDENKMQQKFESKVIELLSRNEDCINPLKELSDSKMLKDMSDTEKQRYIFELSEKYNEVREKYYRQKQAVA